MIQKPFLGKEMPLHMNQLLKLGTWQFPSRSSGGLRNGLEISQGLVLGADSCAMAFSFLKRASESLDSLFMFADTLVTELKSTMFLVGANNLDDLKKARYFVTGHLKEAISN